MTKSPWAAEAEELSTLRGHGGQKFADFVSALILAEGARACIGIDDIKTNTRVTVPDGGIDAEVRVALGGPFMLTVASAWQFKATTFTEVTEADLRKEANKPEATRLIRAGSICVVSVCERCSGE